MAITPCGELASSHGHAGGVGHELRAWRAVSRARGEVQLETPEAELRNVVEDSSGHALRPQ